jgi:hypothetical protein
VEALDPTVELRGPDLKKLIRACIESNRISIDERHTQQRMDERDVTTPEIEWALKAGALSTECSDKDGCWRYRAVRQDLSVIFTFDVDEDGNVLVVVTVIRRQGK